MADTEVIISTQDNVDVDLENRDSVEVTVGQRNTAEVDASNTRFLPVYTDDTTIEYNNQNKLQVIGITDGNDIITYQDIADVIEAQKTYVFEQAIASSTWEIEHNLNKFPSVTVVDSAGDIIMCNVNYVDKNNIRIDFSAEFGGKAYLN